MAYSGNLAQPWINKLEEFVSFWKNSMNDLPTLEPPFFGGMPGDKTHLRSRNEEGEHIYKKGEIQTPSYLLGDMLNEKEENWPWTRLLDPNRPDRPGSNSIKTRIERCNKAIEKMEKPKNGKGRQHRRRGINYQADVANRRGYNTLNNVINSLHNNGAQPCMHGWVCMGRIIGAAEP